MEQTEEKPAEKVANLQEEDSYKAPTEENSCDHSEKLEGEQQEQEEDYKEKYYYLAAEMENMRKRFTREREEFVKYGNEKILRGLIEVVDNLDRTLDSLAEDKDEKIASIVVGIKMVHKQFLDVLQQNGLKTVETEGQIFDPNYHEAMGQQKMEEKQNQEIISVYQKGYILNGRLLRAAKVMIAKND